jgi:hypothetical protein
MSQSYTRQSTFADGDTITAALFNNEYNQLVNAFSYSSTNEGTTGHRHDGSAGEGGNIPQIGDLDFLNKIVVDSTNNRWGFYVQVASSAVEQIRLQDGALIPVTDSDVDLGTSSLYFKDAYIDSVTTTGNVSIGGNLTVTGNATISGNLTFGDADTDSINLAAEIDSNVIPNTDNTYDLGSSSKEWKDIYIDGTAYLDVINFNGTVITSTAAELNILDGVTSTAAELNILDGVTATTAEINTLDGITSTVAELNILDGVTATSTEINILDGVTSTTAELNILDGVTANAAELNILDGVTSTTAELNILDGVTSTAAELNILDGKAFLDEDNMVSNSATGIASQQSIKAYVDAQVTAQDLDIITDSGTIAIDLDSENLTVSGGTGLDSSATGNAVTLAIDSTVTTLTGTQTLTNKTLTTPVISSISNTGTLTLPTSTDTLVGRATTDTLTNKTLTSATLTSPVINTGVSGTAFLDDDTFATATASTLASSESIKAYVDTTVAATNEVVEDTTPQLGGDLDTNGNDILFGDNDKAIFGAGSDLQIYHNGTHSYVSDQGTGSLFLQSSGTVFIQNSGGTANYFKGTDGGAAELFHNGSSKLSTTSTGIDVTGTVTADGLTVTSGSSSDNIMQVFGGGTIYAGLGVDGTGAILTAGSSGSADSDLIIKTSSSGTEVQRARFQDNGDISFYEDTGTTQALFWDASAESLGIGTTSPQQLLTIGNHSTIATSGNMGIRTTSSGHAISIVENGTAGAGTDESWQLGVNSSGDLGFFNSSSTTAAVTFLDSNDNVGIGTSNPGAKLEVTGATLVSDDGADDFVKQSVSGTTSTLSFGSTEATGGLAKWQYSRSTGKFSGFVGTDAATEFMTINSSGNVGIGTNNPAVTLQLSENGTCNFRMTDSSSPTTYSQFVSANGVLQIRADGGNAQGGSSMQFFVDTDESMRIDSSGNVGIGTSSPDTSLQIGDISATNATGQGRIKLEDSSTALSSIGGLEFTTSSFGSGYGWKVNSIDSGGGVHLVFGTRQNSTTWSESMRIDSSGNVGIGTDSPVAKLHIENGDIRIEKDTKATIGFRGHTTGSTALAFRDSNAAVDRMTIDSSGNVGIGTTSPTADLSVGSTSTSSGDVHLRTTKTAFSITPSNTDAGGILLDLGWVSGGQGPMRFGIGSAEKMRINSSGNLLVGTTDTVIWNDTSGEGVVVGPNAIQIARSSDTCLLLNRQSTDGILQVFASRGVQVGSVSVTSSATTYNTSSDARLKDVTGEARGLEVINELNPVSYNWKADGKADEGLIAQEVQEIVPNAVTGSEEDMYQMDYSKLVVHLVKAVKEQQTQIEALQSEINLLKTGE